MSGEVVEGTVKGDTPNENPSTVTVITGVSRTGPPLGLDIEPLEVAPATSPP